MKNDEPEVEELAERLVACVSYVGNYVGQPEVFARLLDRLGDWADPRGLINADSVFLSSYPDDPKTTPPDELRLDVCMSIPESIEVDEDIQKKVLPGGQYAVMRAELSGAEEFGPVWDPLVEWAQQSDYDIDASRPSYEVYLNNPDEHPDKHHTINFCLCLSVKSR
jgi:AraC family transcriptional regulator